jgi:hypothetical protein
MSGTPANSRLAEYPPTRAGRTDGPELNERWSRTRWLKFFILIFTLQVALLFILGEKKPIVPHVVTNAPTMRLAGNTSELIALNDPTLFVLPHQRDFAAAGCLTVPDIKPPSFRWTEPPRWLPLSADGLGTAFGEFMQNHLFPIRPLNFKPEPELSAPVLPPVSEPAQNSTLQIVGELSPRQLPSPISLTNWPYGDVIAPSVVQVMVNTTGKVVSAVLLPPDDGFTAADQYDAADQRALELARGLRFAPAAQLTVGRIIFNWHTVPPTNE